VPDDVIDLRSDAIAHPTGGMREAMANAAVGDEQKREDPSVLELERRAAELLGQDDAVFVPSATMANQIALKTLSQPGDEVVAEARAHIFRNEAGGPAFHSGLQMARIAGGDGIFSGAALRAAVTRNDDPHNAQTAIVCLENTHNASGGNVWTLDQHRDVVAAARELGVAVHLDGARLLNATVAAGVPASAYGGDCDTVTLCLSKGLGCPVGAVVAGSTQHMRRARRLKHLFGGAMRQAGVLAAAGVYALDHHVERLADDHANARAFAEALQAFGVPVVNPVWTNIVLIDIGACGLERETALEELRRAGVLCSPAAGNDVVRAMTHLGVGLADVQAAAERAAAVLSGGVRRSRSRGTQITKLTAVGSPPGVRTRAVVGDSAMLNVTELEPHAEIASHSHPHEQVGTVLEGAVALTVDGERHELRAGDAYAIPGGAQHALTAGRAGARLADTFHPVREDYRAQLAAVERGPGRPADDPGVEASSAHAEPTRVP
jgi:threonine aldolase